MLRDHVALWPRPVQQPMPVWVPISRSRDSIEWAAANDIPITPGMPGLIREDTIRYYAGCLAKRGVKITPRHLNIQIDAYVADTIEQAIAEYGPYVAYFHNVLFNFDHVRLSTVGGYFREGSTEHLRPELRGQIHDDSIRVRDLTVDDIVKRAEAAAWGPPDHVAAQIIAQAEAAGADTILVSMNRGAVPHEMFLKQIDRFGRDVLPRLQAHTVTRVPLAETTAAPV
jgi:alkanesulfonate monooxygenase SsuD/methylene tetrahydromethanopterin reductase-like flavin-dependent oxidoreductase (luciferase family)